MASNKGAPTPRAPRSHNWNEEEDRALCISVVSIGEDGAVDTNQAGGTLWERIYEYFEGIKPPNASKRICSSVESRWKKINPACMRWSIAINKAIKDHKSGENDLDDIRNTKSNYFNDARGEHFGFLHCWDILKDTPKYANPPSMEGDTTNYETPINLDDNDSPGNESTPSMPSRARQNRPMGQKAAKAAKKKGNQELSMSIHDQMKRLADQNDRDHARKEKLYQEAMAAQQRDEDARTMMVDPTTFSPCKRGYWERKQKMILEREEGEMAQNASFRPFRTPQASTPPHGGSSSSPYLPLQQTEWYLNNDQV